MTTIKPPLYLFDPDQTHDLLWAEKIKEEIYHIISDSLGIHSIFLSIPLPKILIERYIPNGDNIPWCSEWSTKYFNFLKKLSITYLLDNQEINGSIYGVTPKYTANLPSSINLGATIPEEIKVKVSKGGIGIVSWLESNQRMTESSTYCPQVEGQIFVIQRQYQIINAIEGEVTLPIFSSWILHNSVVLQNATIEDISEEQLRLLDYAYLDEVLEEIYSQLNISNPEVLTGIDVTLNTEYLKTWYPPPATIVGDYAVGHYLTYSNPSFQELPSNYYYASLIYAVPPQIENLPVFTAEEPKEDLGKDVIIFVSGIPDSIQFRLYINNPFLENNENLINTNIGTDLYKGTKETIFTVSLINNIASGAVTATIVTYTDNHNPNVNMPRLIPTPGVYSGSQATILAPTERRTFNLTVPQTDNLTTLVSKPGSVCWVKSEKCFYVELTNEPDDSLLDGKHVIPSASGKYWYKAPYNASYPIGQSVSPVGGVVTSASSKKGYYFYPEINHSLEPEFQNNWFAPWITFSNVSGDTGYVYKFNTAFVSIQFRASNFYLFSEMKSALFRNDLEETRQTTTLYDEEENPIRVSQSIKHYEVKTIVMFTESISSEAIRTIEAIPTINNSQLRNDNTGLSEENYFEIEQPEEIGGTIISTERLTRTLRTIPIEDWPYITYEGGKKVKLTKEQILLLIEPEPGVFTCQPDTDPQQSYNLIPADYVGDITIFIGDIMPDSIRVKEIHAALQADKFSRQDGSPYIQRYANLGYYIERIARVLGISVNSDGTIRSVRQRKVLVPNNEGKVDIPRGWGRGQWDENAGGRNEGQEGGNLNEIRDGIVYANRSNRNVPSEFNEEAFNLEPPSFVLCENIMQYIESYLEDLDAGLNWQEMGAMAIPAAFNNDDGTRKYCTYEGMGSLLAEVAFMLSSVSQSTSQTFVSSLVTQAISKAVLEALGVPLDILVQEILNMGEGGYEGSKVPIPALSNDSPTLVSLLLNVIENQARILGSSATLDLTPPPQENTQQ